MKKFNVALVSVLSAVLIALTAGGASADGYAQYRGVKDYARPFSWTGFYVGASVGIGTGQTTADLGLPGGFLNTDFEMSGGLIGAQIGYNKQFGNTVIGIEATYSATSLQGNTTCLFILDCKREVDSVGTVVGRLGLAMDRSLLYVLGGVAWADVNSRLGFVGINLASESNTHVGWTAGIGLEYALAPNLTFRIEYSHIDLGKEEYFGVADIDVKMDVVRLGVNFRFN